MEIQHIGEGDPAACVVGLIHGNEPAGKEAIDRMTDGSYDFDQSALFLTVNEAAYEAGERYLDADLNRAFGGEGTILAEGYEGQLAEEMLDVLTDYAVLDAESGVPTLSIHSTHADGVPFLNFSRPYDEVEDTLRSVGPDNAIKFSSTGGAFDGLGNIVEIEVGPQSTPEAADMAARYVENFLQNQGCLAGDGSYGDPAVFEEYGQIPKEDDWVFTAQNFERVPAGGEYARAGGPEGDPITADEAFYPVIASTDGYDDILGYKAQKH